MRNERREQQPMAPRTVIIVETLDVDLLNASPEVVNEYVKREVESLRNLRNSGGIVSKEEKAVESEALSTLRLIVNKLLPALPRRHLLMGALAVVAATFILDNPLSKLQLCAVILIIAAHIVDRLRLMLPGRNRRGAEQPVIFVIRPKGPPNPPAGSSSAPRIYPSGGAPAGAGRSRPIASSDPDERRMVALRMLVEGWSSDVAPVAASKPRQLQSVSSKVIGIQIDSDYDECGHSKRSDEGNTGANTLRRAA